MALVISSGLMATFALSHPSPLRGEGINLVGAVNQCVPQVVHFSSERGVQHLVSHFDPNAAQEFFGDFELSHDFSSEALGQVGLNQFFLALRKNGRGANNHSLDSLSGITQGTNFSINQGEQVKTLSLGQKINKFKDQFVGGNFPNQVLLVLRFHQRIVEESL